MDANYLLTEKFLQYRYPSEVPLTGVNSAEVMSGFGHLLLDRRFAARDSKAALAALAGPECLGRADYYVREVEREFKARQSDGFLGAWGGPFLSLVPERERRKWFVERPE